MSAGQHPQQRLIDGADTQFRQQRLLAAVRQPLAAVKACGRCVAIAVSGFRLVGLRKQRLAKFFRQVSCTVCQYQRRVGLNTEQLTVDISEPCIHGVSGCHGWQSEIDAARKTFLHEPVGEQNGRLGFSRTGDIFQNEQLRSVAKRNFHRQFL